MGKPSAPPESYGSKVGTGHGCLVPMAGAAKATLPENPNRLVVMGMTGQHRVSAGLGAARTTAPPPLLCAREFPARILGSIEGCRCSQFLSQMYLASGAGFATSSHGNQTSALSPDYFFFSISQMTLAP